VNVRIIAATNQDLTRLIKEERFRTDLYYRLRGATITLPPLRERRDDIPELAHHFLFRHNRLLNTAAQSISQEAMEILCAHDWPGNVRELQNVVREALIVSIGPTILPEFIPPELHLKHGDTDPEGDIEAMPDLGEAGLLPTMIERYLADGEGDVYRRVRDHFDALVISRALKASGGSQRRAAELLGLSRITLREKLRALKRAATPA
jgi:two-component system nitrogen regulation response regulator GlnG